VHPLEGLYAAFIMGLVTAAFGSRTGMISGATGALTMAIIYLLPRVTEALPSALAGLVAVSPLLILPASIPRPWATWLPSRAARRSSTCPPCRSPWKR
jgi:MFS superfamily sulfate permease-like transporter